MFFKVLTESLKIRQIRKKILFTIFILLVFRLGTQISVPGIDVAAVKNLQDLPFVSMLSLVSGNALSNFSIFALGVSPYITASIVVQLLQMDLVPKFVEWGKQGEVGRRKLSQATRYISLFLAFLQAIGITIGFDTLSEFNLTTEPLTPNLAIEIGLILTTGSMIVSWLGEQITEKGYGNGTSMIIFAGIISSLPTTFTALYNDFFVNVSKDQRVMSASAGVAVVIVVLAIVYITTYIQQAKYKIPIQYTRRAQGAPANSYLPLKLNPAGVIPVIFAGSVVAIPSTITQILSSQHATVSWLVTIQKYFNYSTPQGALVYAFLIVLFTFFYSFVQINPEKTAENLQKSGAYIHSVRPGEQTEKYIGYLLRRLATVGSLFLAVVALLPVLANMAFATTGKMVFLGTSLIIVIMTSLEGIKQLEGYLMKRQYTGFMNTDA